MEIPKEVQSYCIKCNKHTEHKLKAFKAGKTRALAIGQRSNVRKHKKGHGGKAKHTAIVKKQNKKPTFVKECLVCGTKGYFIIPKRMKKAELVSAK
ncbi:MAG: 50S ribosomal protein L44e [Candidatus Diapherotrites archaeon]